MEILVFAFFKEAQSFIEYFNLKKNGHPDRIEYSDNTRTILICGPGVSNVKKHLPGFIKSKSQKISRIINIGIAGSVDISAQLNQIYSVRKVFLDKEIENGSFESGDKQAILDCITVQKPAFGLARANELQKIAHITDMELWAIASVASSFKLPYYSIKYISDMVQQSILPKDIFVNAKLYSDQLCEYFNRHFKQ